MVANSPLSFKKIKEYTLFWEKGPDCVRLWVKFFIRNVVLTVSRRESQFFPSKVFSSCIFDKMFFEFL